MRLRRGPFTAGETLLWVGWMVAITLALRWLLFRLKEYTIVWERIHGG